MLQSLLFADVPLQFHEESSSSVGRVQAYNNNSWRPVCRQEWGDYESRALCEVFGYNGTEGKADENTTKCGKNNTSTQQCIHFDTLAGNCSVQEEVPVIACKGTQFKTEKGFKKALSLFLIIFFSQSQAMAEETIICMLKICNVCQSNVYAVGKPSDKDFSQTSFDFLKFE